MIINHILGDSTQTSQKTLKANWNDLDVGLVYFIMDKKNPEVDAEMCAEVIHQASLF